MARFLFLLALFPALPLFAADSSGGQRGDGTYRGRVITERFLHRQAQSRRPAQAAALSAEQQPLQQDRGDIAIIDTRNGVVAVPNFVDIQGLTFRFTPVGAGFAGTSEPQRVDQQARDMGVSLALGDDEARRVDLPFSFPFYGESHDSVFVHSDGTLTFVETDTDTSSRTLARAAAGPPRIAPMFVDLDPSRVGARVRSFVQADRAVFTWDGVPQFSVSGTGRRQAFQAEIKSDGSIAFHYLTADLNAIVVGVFPGRLAGDVRPVDLSNGFPASAGGFAEQFQLIANTDIFAASQQFYRGHDDAYDFLILFNNLNLNSGPGSFAFEVNVRNEIEGIGDLLSPSPIFDFGEDFGSARRLTSFVNMGPLSQYPSDPSAVVPLIGENSTLSVLGQEVGHRWGAYVDFVDPATGLTSSALLGRQEAHWSFFYNSNASVLEGNRIEDQGEGVTPRFRTTATVEQFSELDQYLMGLRAPQDVPASFLVEAPSNVGSTAPGRPPQTGVTFNGRRKEIPLDLIVAAEGPRKPGFAVAEKEFRFAFVLLVDPGTQIPQADIDKIDRIRREWEQFFEEAVDGRATGSTELARMLHLSAWPAAGVFEQTTGAMRVEIAEPLAADLTVSLASDFGAVGVPASVVIPAGMTFAEFPLVGGAPGVALVTAEAAQPGYDRGAGRVLVNDRADEFTIEIISGDDQAGQPGEFLPEPVVVEVRDENNLPYSGFPVRISDGEGEAIPEGEFTVDGLGIVRAATGFDGRLAIRWRIGSGPSLLAIHLDRGDASAAARARIAGDLPKFSSTAVVNAASFNIDGASEGLAPGSLATIFGTDLALQAGGATAFPLPRELAGVRVRVNGAEAPLVAVFPGQINFQFPFEAAPGAASSVVVSTVVGESVPAAVAVAETDPGVFFDSASGVGAIRFSADGQVAFQRAARPGEALEIFGTGFGAVDPRTETGEAAMGFILSHVREDVEVLIGGRRLEPLFAGLAPLFAGLYQVNVVLPEDLPPGSYELRISVGGRLSNAVRIEVQ